MGKRPRDKTKVRKVKVPPTPNKGPVQYQVQFMPTPSEKGSHNKWSEPMIIEGKNRRSVAKELRSKYPAGGWKLRLA